MVGSRSGLLQVLSTEIHHLPRAKFQSRCRGLSCWLLGAEMVPPLNAWAPEKLRNHKVPSSKHFPWSTSDSPKKHNVERQLCMDRISHKSNGCSHYGDWTSTTINFGRESHAKILWDTCQLVYGSGVLLALFLRQWPSNPRCFGPLILILPS